MSTPIPGDAGGFSYIGRQYYSLTWRCYESHRLLTQRDRVDLVRTQILRASIETNVVNIAYCYMPDHLHQVIKGDSYEADAEVFIAKAKQYSGYYFKQIFGERLWFRKGSKQVLPDDDPAPVVRYVIGNPVRAGLVSRVEDYPYSGSETRTMKELMEWVYAL